MSSISTKMGLIKWTALSDRFDYQELADNFEKIDGHNHIPTTEPGGTGGTPIPAGGLALLSVATGNIQDNAVNEYKLASSTNTDGFRAVTADHIQDQSVTTAKIADNAVTSAKISLDLTAEIDDAIEAGVAQLESLSGFQESWQEPIAVGPFDYTYEFSNSTTDSAPGNGLLRFNNATLSSVTKIYVENTDGSAPSQSLSANLTSVTNSGKPTINVLSENGSFATFQITGTENAGTYFKLTVILLDQDGAFVDGDLLAVSLYKIQLSGGWNGPARYYRDSTDRVHIELGRPGEPAQGPWNQVAFYLPEGYRPSESAWITSYPGMLRVYPDGRVRPMNNLLGFEPKPTDTTNQTPLFIATGSFRAA
jgi:hypothetical protein